MSRELAAAHGSVSDVLRTLPSVEVDVDGSISLRGDPNVQILVDGKPSIQFSGTNRALALQQMAADGIDTVEVMTNPSAEFGPEGTGGIINLVSRKARRAGRTGAVQWGVGSFGRWGAGVNGAITGRTHERQRRGEPTSRRRNASSAARR